MSPRLRIVADPAWGWSTGPAWGLNGFRHPPEAEYPAGFFTEAQLERLREDPALTIEDLPDEEEGGEAEGGPGVGTSAAAKPAKKPPGTKAKA